MPLLSILYFEKSDPSLIVPSISGMGCIPPTRYRIAPTRSDSEPSFSNCQYVRHRMLTLHQGRSYFFIVETSSRLHRLICNRRRPYIPAMVPAGHILLYLTPPHLNPNNLAVTAPSHPLCKNASETAVLWRNSHATFKTSLKTATFRKKNE